MKHTDVYIKVSLIKPLSGVEYLHTINGGDLFSLNVTSSTLLDNAK